MALLDMALSGCTAIIMATDRFVENRGRKSSQVRLPLEVLIIINEIEGKIW